MNKKVLKVVTPQGKYPIIIGHNAIADIGTHLKPILKNNRVFIVTSKKVIKIYKKKLLNILSKNNIVADLIIINDDEKQKNFNTISKISNTLLKKGIDRNDSLVAFGGGVIGDITGFVSSIILRGINFIPLKVMLETNPLISPITPPPKATNASFLSIPFFKRAFEIFAIVLKFF